MKEARLENEIEHGRLIAKKGEEIWNWSSPAGRLRWSRRIEAFKNFLGNEGKRVLEVGCGTGLFTRELAGRGNPICAIDVSNDLLELAKRRINDSNVIFKLVDAHHTGFADGSFDFIIGSSVLHHLDADRALKEFHRLLAPGGQIMFTEPNMLNPQIAVQKNIRFIKKMAGDSPDETAFIRWRLAKKLAALGFKQAKITPFDFIHPFLPSSLFVFLPALNFMEKIPLLREIAGSLIIQAEK